MSPPKFYSEQLAKKESKGSRPPPLKIHKESRMVQKSSSSSSSSSTSSSLTGIPRNHPPAAHQQQRHPVIIYTHSPKVIHTKARDFMALVQKLTGLSHSDNERMLSRSEEKSNMTVGGGTEDNSSSSVVTDENCGGVITDVHGHASSLLPSAFDPPNPYMSDVPAFTPNSSEFFSSSSRPYYRSSDHVFSSPNMGSISSPSVLEFMKGCPDYCN